MFINLFVCLLLLVGACQDTATKAPELVIDTKCETTGLPERFRRDEALHASGSGEFYESGLQAIISNVSPYKLLVVDLREESHGFINGIPITWFGRHNWANQGKSLQEIEQDETGRLNALKKLTSVDGIHIHSVMSEEELCTSVHANYLRIPVQDNSKPSDYEVNRFIAKMKEVQPDVWVHFHCYAGIGRTTLFLVMLDMMQHAKQDSFEEIIMRQKNLGGIDLRKVAKASRKVAKRIEERKEFIEQFYNYCKNNNDKFQTPFIS